MVNEMANLGYFVGRLYMGWGTRSPKRRTESRPEIDDEAYISIPRADAQRLSIYMSNHPGVETDYEWTSSDGAHRGILKAQGNVCAGDVYAKQFAVSGNLKGLKNFIEDNGLSDDSIIQIDIVEPNKLVITPLS